MGSASQPLNNLYYSLRRHFVDEFHLCRVPRLAPGSRVLDLGGHKILKRGRFNIEHYDLRVFYANLSAAKRPDVQMDAARISFRDECFDAVICSELLEHVPEPVAVLREVHRVLRRRGTLLICVPFLVAIHGDPGDYGRYTDTYWEETLRNLGFEQVIIERQGAYWSVLWDLWREMLIFKLEQNRSAWGWAFHLLGQVLLRLRRRTLDWEAQPAGASRSFYQRYATGFGIVAVKG